MMRRNLLSAILLFMTAALFQVSLVSSHTAREAQATEFAGYWRLLSATGVNGTVEGIPTNRTILITMNPQSIDAIRVTIKAANTFSTIITLLGTKLQDGSFNIKVGGLPSSRMRAPLDLQSMERFIMTSFVALNNVNIVNSTLVLKGPNATKLECMVHIM